ncbi:MAG: AbrB/MazE/SpoVT family DNA-binding domain-containing protein [Candidatus Helarchaeota archaeon]
MVRIFISSDNLTIRDNMIVESKVGSKGELFLTKNIRKALGWKPGDTIFFEVRENELIVQRVPDLLELLEKPLLREPESPDEIEKELEQFFTIQLHTIP